MEQILAVLAWPVVVLVVALVALSLFRGPLGALIGRTKKVGKGGIETFESQPAHLKNNQNYRLYKIGKSTIQGQCL